MYREALEEYGTTGTLAANRSMAIGRDRDTAIREALATGEKKAAPVPRL